MRACERCGEGMAPGRPRVRVGGKQLWCQTCAKDIDSPSGRYRPGTDIAKQASDWHEFDSNRHYRRGHVDGANGVYDQDHDSLSAKADMGIPLEPHEVDYMAGHAAGTDRAREHARAKHDIKRVWEEHGQPYGDPTLPSPRTASLLEPDMNRKVALTDTRTGQRIVVVAHDSGDGQTIYHCPFCGSGQVIARSDRTIECEFCHTAFTVQVQPEYSAFPQTDPQTGLPIQVPGMPGQIDSPVGAQPDPAADPNADPGQDLAATGQDANQDGVDDGFQEQDPASAGNQPPWLKGAVLHTASGQALAPADYIRHLAIKHADDRSAVLMQVRATRSAR